MNWILKFNLKKNFVQINQDQKIENSIKLLEKIKELLSRKKKFVWDHAWAMDDVQVHNLAFQYHQTA